MLQASHICVLLCPPIFTLAFHPVSVPFQQAHRLWDRFVELWAAVGEDAYEMKIDSPVLDRRSPRDAWMTTAQALQANKTLAAASAGWKYVQVADNDNEPPISAAASASVATSAHQAEAPIVSHTRVLL
jgi:hypothetical protein